MSVESSSDSESLSIELLDVKEAAGGGTIADQINKEALKHKKKKKKAKKDKSNDKKNTKKDKKEKKAKKAQKEAAKAQKEKEAKMAMAVLPRRAAARPAIPQPSAAAFMEAFSARITGCRRPLKADNETQAFALAARTGVVLKVEAEKAARAAAAAALAGPPPETPAVRGPARKPEDMAGNW